MIESSYQFYGIEEHVASVFSQKLKEVRVASGLTQKQFAKEFGISTAALSYYETGKRIPDITFLAKLQEYFHIPTDYFLGYTNTTNYQNSEASRKTHLSGLAIDNICRFIENSYEFTESEVFECDDILNRILEDADFYNILDIVTLNDLDYYFICPDFRYPDSEYITFIATREIMKVLNNAIKKMNDEQKQIPLLLKSESLEIQDDFVKWFMEVASKNNSKEVRKAKFESMAEDYKHSLRYEALKKLQEETNEKK